MENNFEETLSRLREESENRKHELQLKMNDLQHVEEEHQVTACYFGYLVSVLKDYQYSI